MKYLNPNQPVNLGDLVRAPRGTETVILPAKGARYFDAAKTIRAHADSCGANLAVNSCLLVDPDAGTAETVLRVKVLKTGAARQKRGRKPGGKS